jgi:PTH1 family peptidyl-tRNA hydrolase
MAEHPWLIVGLGNPGPQDVVEGRLGTTRVILTKPKTYMNESGGPVAAIRSFFGVPIEQVIVVHDELDLDVGVVRLKFDGGDNGHNGLRSVTKSLGSKDYLRVRIGVGRPPGRMDPAAFVLTDVPAAGREDFRTQLEIAADAVESLLARGLEATQNAFHQTP